MDVGWRAGSQWRLKGINLIHSVVCLSSDVNMHQIVPKLHIRYQGKSISGRYLPRVHRHEHIKSLSFVEFGYTTYFVARKMNYVTHPRPLPLHFCDGCRDGLEKCAKDYIYRLLLYMCRGGRGNARVPSWYGKGPQTPPESGSSAEHK